MKRTAERIEFLGDVITTAVEGGTGYWASVSQYQYTDDLDGTRKVHVYTGGRHGDETRAVLHELNDDETGYKAEGLVLNLDAVARGLGKLKRGEIGINSRLLGEILTADCKNDACYLDADSADVIAQAGLLGEVRYG